VSAGNSPPSKLMASTIFVSFVSRANAAERTRNEELGAIVRVRRKFGSLEAMFVDFGASGFFRERCKQSKHKLR
jgi:hypothetical protein